MWISLSPKLSTLTRNFATSIRRDTPNLIRLLTFLLSLFFFSNFELTASEVDDPITTLIYLITLVDNLRTGEEFRVDENK